MDHVKEERRLYRYEGAVLIFDRVVAHNYHAQTLAADHIPVKLTGEPVAL